ncbi:MAG: RNA polymerase sigma factor (sigma-70 family) [Verrucomicrobiales bacterium]|jgi:RNA polymerase sigma factor (sigma-70 family)
MLPDNDEAALVARFRDGEEAALEIIISRHKDPLFRFVVHYLNDATEAADVVSETFIRAWRNRASYRPNAALQTWLFAIGVNLCRDHARKRKRRPGDFAINQDESNLTRLVGGSQPDEEAERRDEVEQLRQAINALPHDLKTALVLNALEGHSQDEVAKMLGCSRKAIETRVYRARKMLKAALA